jgi:hypothetical protein
MPPVEAPTGFAELGVPARIDEGLAAAGFAQPFAIQTEAIPLAMLGRDVCGRARTGSGKTLAFGVPMMARILDDAEPTRPLGLVLVPTRELAVQVAEVLEPARRGHEDVGAPGELGLLLDAHAAVGDGHRERLRATDVGQLPHDLQGELARGRQHQGGWALRLGRDPLHERNAEGERLARPGGRLHEHVPARERVRDYLLLYEKRGFHPAAPEGVADGRRDAEIGE